MITILSGSPRKNSNTLRVAKAIKRSLIDMGAEDEINLIDFNGYDIPSANVGAMTINKLSLWQKELYESMLNARLVFFLTPEYNWFPSAEIVQMIHSLASTPFKAVWQDKVFVTCGTSSGRGGRMPAVQLSYTINKVLGVFHCESIVSPKMFESQFTDKVLDQEGYSLGNEEYMKGLNLFVEYNLRMADRWNK